MLPQNDKTQALRRELIEGTIKTVAALGLENTTTNASGLNVAIFTNVSRTKRI